MLNLIIKDLKNMIYDKKVLIALFGMPIILMTILGSALQGSFSSDSGVADIKIAIVKEYNYEEEMKKSQNLMDNFPFGEIDIDVKEMDPEKIMFEDFLGSEGLSFIKYQEVSLDKANQLMEEEKISAIVILPKNYVYDFITSMTIGRNKFEIEVIKSPEHSFTAGIIEQIFQSFIRNINGKIAYIKTTQQVSMVHDIEIPDLKALLQEQEELVSVKSEEVTGSKPINSFQYYAAAIMCMFLLYAASTGGKALLEERRDFTAQRLEVSGVGIIKTATSNMVRMMLITIMQTIVTILFTSIVLKVDWGDLVTVMVGMIFTGFAISGMGTFVATATYVADKVAIANIFEIVVLQFMALIGGSFIPVQILPKAIQKLQIFSANGSALKIYLNAMYHKPLSDSYIYLFALVTIGLVFTGISYSILWLTKGRVTA